MFQEKGADNIKTHILFSMTPPPPPLKKKLDNVEKCGKTRQATDDNMAHATWNLQYLLHAPTSSGFTNGPPCYIYTYIAYLVNLFIFTK
jgi:hypothetical protein